MVGKFKEGYTKKFLYQILYRFIAAGTLLRSLYLFRSAACYSRLGSYGAYIYFALSHATAG